MVVKIAVVSSTIKLPLALQFHTQTPPSCNSSNLNLLDPKSAGIVAINILERIVPHHIMAGTIWRLEEMLHNQSNILESRYFIRANRRVLTSLEFVGDIAALAVC